MLDHTRKNTNSQSRPSRPGPHQPGTLREQLAQYFPMMIRHPALILCLYLLIMSRLAAFGRTNGR